MEGEEAINSFLIEMKYSCKFCQKRFPCGRSLGGHMRSHLITNTSHQQKVNTTTLQFKNKKHQQEKELIPPPPPPTDGEAEYELREKPKKTWRAVGSTQEDPADQDPNLLPFQGTNSFCCKECGKGFQSSKALSGHMKSHRLLVDHDDSHNNQQSQSDIINNRPRRSNRKPISGNANSSNNGSSSSVSEIDQQEQEEVAMCLILLSRDVGPFSDNNSVFLETPLTRVRLREDKIDDDLDADEYTTSGYLAAVVKVKSGEEFEVSEVELGHNLSSKKGKYECSTCNKSFHSHQALGGHRASHKKVKGCSSWIPPPAFQPQEVSGEGSRKVAHVIQKHECPVCFKVFASGQALGGHKRSHVIAQARFESKAISVDKSTTTTTNTTTTSNHEVKDFLDLNQPAPVEEEASNGCNQLHQKPWWVDSTSKHEHLVGMI